ncbi:phage tail assembly protein [Roseibium album]|uniref:phage tail assembly protein n=1 Tax=Roseibium album TaxID=311410 RepID=UPI0024933518|nr:phage tail assembly protein [Roseibium album]
MSKKVNGMVMKLATPVSHEGATYNELTLRRMKAGDSLVAEEHQSQAKAGMALFAAMAGVPVEVIMELDMDDFMDLTEKAAPLMGKSGLAMLKEAETAGQ